MNFPQKGRALCQTKNVTLMRYVKSSIRGWYRKSLSVSAIEATRRGRGFSVRWDDGKSLYGKDVTDLGAYQLRWYEGSKSKYQGAGNEIQEALLKRDQKIADLAYEKAALEAGREPEKGDTGRLRLIVAKKEFLKSREDAGKEPKTVVGYDTVISEFLTVCGKTFADQITGQDLLSHCGAMRKRGLRERSVSNNYSSVATFLRYCKIDHKVLLDAALRPKEPKVIPKEYTPDEVVKFLSAIDTPRQALYFELLLTAGLREREGTYLQWSDIDFRNHLITIQGSKDVLVTRKDGTTVTRTFKTKTREPRTVVLADGLAERLLKWREMTPRTNSDLVFATKRGVPDRYLLRACKKIAYKAGINCGRCDLCIKTEGKRCRSWRLKNFRSTFATWMLRGHVDVGVVQGLMGHAKLSMT